MKTKFSLWSLVVVLILSVFLFTGCDELLNPPKKVTSVTITQNDQAIILGNTLQLTATVAPSDATNKDVIWSSSDTSVATVSASGLVSTVATGSATITATTEDQNKTDTVIITVNPVPIAVTGVTIDQNDQAIFVGSTLQLSATIAPSNATNTNVTWSSSNTSAATVSTTGLVSAVAAGSATITVTTEDQSKTDTVVITVNPVVVTGVTINENAQSITVGSTLQLSTTIAPSNATNTNVTWSSSNTSAATVSATGLVSAVAVGTTTITATTEDQSKTDTVVITVSPVVVTGVTIDQNDQAIFVGGTLQLTANIAPSNAANTNVTWSSSNASAATVSATGLVSAVAVGTTTITVTTVDQSKTDTVVITVNPVVVTGVTINENAQSITVGSTLQLSATIAPSNATNTNVTWSSSNTSAATVSATGLVSAVAVGTTTITATTDDQSKTDTVVITVNPVPVTGVTIDQDDQIISANSTLQLTATIAPSNAANKNVTWSSSNTSVATVSATGLVSAVAAGSATITVTTVDQSKTDTIDITVKNNYVAMTLTNKTNASDIRPFLLESGPAQSTTFESFATFVTYDVPTHLVLDIGFGNGSMMVATTKPSDTDGGGDFYPANSADYPFTSFFMFALGAVDSSCIGTGITTNQFTVSTKTAASTETFRASPDSSTQLVAITFTEFGTTYVAGTFTGEVTDDHSVAYDVTGSFRILRATPLSN